MKILLDVCCGPCMTQVIRELKDEFRNYEICGFFPNSNIDTIKEFDKRLNEAKVVSEKNNVSLISEKYNHKDWLEHIKGYEDEPEGKKRCEKCFRYRLETTAKKAKELSFEAITTTLTVSPYKNYEIINEIGKKVTKKHGIKFLARNFKKNEGYKKSIELSKSFELYRQKYCGCEFSKR